ncbi:hypothetical protein CfE428DRAFT_6656 [Chthoniobacter flavus Ellin428]|uniref:Uncharacterized protein n=1 Tax=Chthoniobacter flavus Ellin428 TaxID=497964 RepID=B4DCL5_9BACT|nr:hypothetical protein [Chthoniobacter flavus]EDY15829.1 hypothetical protein CfE428DRAFT_6656 [Chthoniobacter flavus Ellin428]TCO81870.1 hypothetical protein EV701_15211 [Chthoniobacter flavus]
MQSAKSVVKNSFCPIFGTLSKTLLFDRGTILTQPGGKMIGEPHVSVYPIHIDDWQIEVAVGVMVAVAMVAIVIWLIRRKKR